MGSQILVTVLFLLGTVGLFVTMDLQKIADFGESLGYTGKDLQLFVKEQIDIQLAKEQAEREREERANAREAKKFEQELEKAKLEREKERERMEVEKARIEAEKEKVRLQVELEKEKAQIEMKERVELEKIKKENSMSEVPENGTPSLSGKPKMPKMPPFEDQKDNIDAYLHRFERIARTQAWPESQWAPYLSTLLKGKALEVYSRLDQNDAEKYEEVKAALLKRYDMTEDGFHQRFRTGKIETGETFSQFVVRIENYFTRWIELSSTEKTFEGVKDLLLREQILNSTGRDLSIFLRERTPKTAMEMAKLAEQFVEARGTGCSKFQNPLYSKSNKYVHPDRSKEKGYEDSRKVKNTDDKRESNKFVPINQRKCFTCGEVGHMASRCSKPHAKGMKVASICQEDSVGMVQDGYINDDQGGAHVEENKISENNVGKVTSGTMCGMCGTMPICQGKVFDHTVQVLRDTGCSGVIVRKALVDKQHFTSDTQTCVMADSRAVVIPVAWITIDTPFYRGTVKAACLETPLCDLILGNIPGVRAPDNPFPELTEPVLAVETRGQKRVREEGKIPMKTMESVGVSLSRNEFMEMQKQDESLKKMWKLAEENKVRNTTQGTSGYFIDHGLLYRRHVSAKVNNSKPVVQAVVPISLRRDVLRVSHEALMGGHMGSKKTLDRVTSQFYWPGVQGDVRRYCISCDICHRTTPKGKISKIPLGTMPLIETPFERWKGPYIIEERFGIGNYRVRVGDKLKTYHANLLKKYVDREIAVNTMMCDVSIASLQYVGAGLVDVQEPMDEVSSGSEQLDVMTIPLTAKETYLDVDISPDLTPEQKQDVRELAAEYQDVLTDLPGRTDSIEYKIKLTSTEPIRSKPYPLPHHMREVVAREVESMLSMDVIEPSESPYAAPVVLIKKSDESYRFCTDFRKLNQISVFHPEPIPLAEAVFSKLSKCKYLTKIDISKAYWQIPMEEGSKKYTAFITPDGLYQWKVMPFGVVNAPAVFSRLMRKVLKDIPNVDNYIDDIIEGTEDWENHKHSLRMVFDHLRQHHLTARPSKVKIGYTHLEFLGHTVGEGQLAPKPHNLDKILNLARPETKKQDDLDL
ncbi:uncharacterized protein [Haliotis asinina]|uniref:uncharacterized protein n=1 Tax=Haliotis asinina TaxID=109174 RepID=UPI003531A017